MGQKQTLLSLNKTDKVNESSLAQFYLATTTPRGKCKYVRLCYSTVRYKYSARLSRGEDTGTYHCGLSGMYDTTVRLSLIFLLLHTYVLRDCPPYISSYNYSTLPTRVRKTGTERT